MKMTKKATKPLTLFAAVFVILSCFTMMASAATATLTANLTADMKIAYSGTLTGKQCYYSGKNTSKASANSQKGVVYAITKYKSGAIYVSDVSYTMAAGDSFSKNTTSKFSSSKTWKLALNPKGSNATGCTASGKIWKKQ